MHFSLHFLLLVWLEFTTIRSEYFCDTRNLLCQPCRECNRYAYITYHNINQCLSETSCNMAYDYPSNKPSHALRFKQPRATTRSPTPPTRPPIAPRVPAPPQQPPSPWATDPDREVADRLGFIPFRAWKSTPYPRAAPAGPFTQVPRPPPRPPGPPRAPVFGASQAVRHQPSPFLPFVFTCNYMGLCMPCRPQQTCPNDRPHYPTVEICQSQGQCRSGRLRKKPEPAQ